MKKIILTGGGTAGHVTPNLALVPLLKEAGYDILYIGSKTGIEKEIVEEEGLKYVGISSGKLRRYFDWKNFTDPARVLRGYEEARRIIKEYKPDVVFSKGGFVSVPVVYAATRYHIPTITHESDMTPGLANKLNIRRAQKICTNFPETAKMLPAEKAICTGCPIRAELYEGDPKAGRDFLEFDDKKPVLLIIGGSLGSVRVNRAVREALPELMKTFQVVHLCGKGNMDYSLLGKKAYAQFEYVNAQLKDIFAITDIVISRAGANAICELVALKKPNILIPLGSAASRGDQILNAESFKKQGFSEVLLEENLTKETLLKNVFDVFENREAYIEKMNKSDHSGATRKVFNLIDEMAKNSRNQK